MKVQILQGLLEQMDCEIKRLGFQDAVRLWVKRSGNKVVVKGLSKELTQILTKEPVLIALNHPYQAETFALLSLLPNREDVHIIADEGLMHLVPSVDRHTIPVYVSHHNNPSIASRLISLITQRFKRGDDLTAEVAHEKNVESINDAAKRISKGGMVIICPERHDARDSWYDGIGYLAKAIINPKACYLQVYVEGTSHLDYLRYFSKLGALLPSITVAFAKPELVSKISVGDAKQVARRLEKKYYDWTNKL